MTTINFYDQTDELHLCACAHDKNRQKVRLEAMVENLCSRPSFLLTALFLTITSISVVSGQSGEWLIPESVTDQTLYYRAVVFLYYQEFTSRSMET